MSAHAQLLNNYLDRLTQSGDEISDKSIQIIRYGRRGGWKEAVTRTDRSKPEEGFVNVCTCVRAENGGGGDGG